VARSLVITVSDRASAGMYADKGGPLIVSALTEAGFEVDGPIVVPDGGPVEVALRSALDAGYDIVITTGGTGLAPRDQTPQMTARVLDYEVPGIAEAIRAARARRCRRADVDREPARINWRRARRDGGFDSDPSACCRATRGGRSSRQ
jgi:molybdenum cofactor synthesis domain-containing protein